MNKSPAFQWYPKDILSSARVQEMSLVEECAYRRLIDFCWINGSIPKDVKRATNLVGKRVSSVSVSVALSMFSNHPDDPELLIHDRLEKEREKQATTRTRRQEAAASRWEKTGSVQSKGDANASANAKQKQCSSSSSSIATAVVFKRPTLQEIAEYSDSLTPTFKEAEKFLDHYTSNGWKVGKVAMKDWKATVRKWNRDQAAKAAPQKTRSLFD